MNNTNYLIKAFRIQALVVMVCLIVQFVLGMYTALYVQFPDTLVNGNGWSWSMQESPIIMAHVILGSLLVLLAISMIGFGLAARSKPAIISALTGLGMTGLAYLSGGAFLANVANNDSSFLMALGFMGCVLAYGTAYYFTRPEAHAQTEVAVLD